MARRAFYALCTHIDHQIRLVLGMLREEGLLQDTIILFTCDHGDMLGDHQLMVKGAFFYDASVRVPLIIRWPNRFAGGRRLPQLVQLHDLAATVLSAAGCLPASEQAAMPHSRDLVPLGAGEIGRVREHAVCCYRNTGILDSKEYPDPEIHCTMIRDERYKLNVYHAPPTEAGVDGELYDMREDPNEVRNLWARPGFENVRTRLTGELVRWLAAQELRLGSRGGEIFPRPAERVKIL